jgi:protein-disulfide isomerase
MTSSRAATLSLRICVAIWPSIVLGASSAGPGLDARFSAGEPSSQVVLTMYACGRSQSCAKLIPPLYQEVVAGRLKGKVRLYFRPFCLTETEDAVACCRALVAAAGQGAFWQYLLHMYEHQEDFHACVLKKWADFKGLDRDAFELAVEHPNTKALLAEVRRDALEKHVDTVPTAYVNGRKIACALSLPALLDVLEEESAREAGMDTLPALPVPR